MFKSVFPFKPAGDQPKAIEKLVKNLKSGIKNQVLLGVTGSGKTFTISNVINKIQRPALIILPNKCLAAQLYQEFKEFFPENSIHYFVSYYDYYQPEAYIPQSDTYIQKDAKINKEIDQLRHAAVQDLLVKKDIIIIASVSCIYNIGSPENYQRISLKIKKGQKIKRSDLISHLISLQYQRNDINFNPGTFRVRGDILEVNLITGKKIIKIELSENTIKEISDSPALTLPKYKTLNTDYSLYPAHFWVTPQEKLKIAIENIKLELRDRLKELKKQKKFIEAQRLEQKTNYDLEMMEQSGYCHGIENYSRQLEFRKTGESPFTLLDYLNMIQPLKKQNSKVANFLVFIDESHQTVSQLRAMAEQDKIRKKTLIDHGFRLPSAVDNRPLTFKEFEEKTPQTVYISATPKNYEKEKSGKNYIVEQLIRPTGLIEPLIEIRSSKNQLQNLSEEIKKTIKEKQKALVLTLTKRLAEALNDYLSEKNIKTRWLHSEVKTLERPQIIKDLREGKYDVLVGINLLREGLDLPEVALVAILDADKEGFLRSETTLIQTMGRASRNIKGRVILYGDKISKSMKAAIKETKRRRKIQTDYNLLHKIKPSQIKKEIRSWSFTKEEGVYSEFGTIKDIKYLTKEMGEAAEKMDFERAAKIRDLIQKLKTENIKP